MSNINSRVMVTAEEAVGGLYRVIRTAGIRIGPANVLDNPMPKRITIPRRRFPWRIWWCTLAAAGIAGFLYLGKVGI